jgi:hypothetical protein
MSHEKPTNGESINVAISIVGTTSPQEVLTRNNRALAIRYLRQLRIGLDNQEVFSLRCETLEGREGVKVPMEITSPTADQVEVALYTPSQESPLRFTLDNTQPVTEQEYQSVTVIKNALFDAVIQAQG